MVYSRVLQTTIGLRASALLEDMMILVRLSEAIKIEEGKKERKRRGN